MSGRLGAGDRLVVEHRGDAQAGVLDEMTLDQVDLVSDALRRRPTGGGQRSDLTDAVSQDCLERVQAQVAGGEDGLGLDAGELLRLLLDRHLAQQQLCTIAGREAGVPEGRVGHFILFLRRVG